MPRRYDRRRSYRSSRGGSRRRTVTRAAFFRTASRKKTAGWRWLLTGLLVGSVVTGMLYINEHPLDGWRPEYAQTQKKQPPILQANAQPKRDYAFYKLLSNPTHASESPLKHSSVPAMPTIKSRVTTSVTMADNKIRTHAIPEASTEQPALGSVTAGNVHLQLASFPKRADAKRLQSQLKNQGIASNIEIAQVKGRVWYRVQSPQLPSDAAALVLKQRLQSYGVNASLVHHG